MASSRAHKRIDARVTRSRRAMQQALLALLARMPLDAISGAAIAEQARIGYATFFRHYADVRALLADTVAVLTDELAEGMMPAWLASDSGGAATILVRAVEVQRATVGALLSGGGDALRAELVHQVIERAVILPDLAPSWLPRRLALRIGVTATIELLDWWLSEEPAHDPVAVATLLDRLVFAQLGDDATR
jgi:AcrR family transcriptional regulator